MNYELRKDEPRMIKINKVVKETANIKTFYFSTKGGSASGEDHSLNSKPGQFVMIWIPGVDQKPFSIGHDNGKEFGLTVCAVGNLSKKFSEMKAGDRVGISGPYGTNFSVLSDTHYIMVAGGYGAAPLGFLAEEASKQKGTKIDFLIGARSCDDILFEKKLSKLKNVTVHCATDDGSKGHSGFVTDLLSKSIGDSKKKKLVCTCGPEMMEKKVLNICIENDIDCEISVERYMKCGFGICGQCCVDDLGFPMCNRGPVVNKKLAKEILEFGKYHRDKAGAKHNF